MNYDWDYEEPDCDVRVLKDRVSVARKPHSCNGCDFGGIKPGEKYRLVVLIEEGRFKIERFCTHSEFDGSFGQCRRDSQGLEDRHKSMEEWLAKDAQAWAESDALAQQGSAA